MARFQTVLAGIWDFLRDACGENDYAHHLIRARAEGSAPLSPHEFYLLQLRQKYTRPCRCC